MSDTKVPFVKSSIPESCNCCRSEISHMWRICAANHSKEPPSIHTPPHSVASKKLQFCRSGAKIGHDVSLLRKIVRFLLCNTWTVRHTVQWMLGCWHNSDKNGPRKRQLWDFFTQWFEIRWITVINSGQHYLIFSSVFYRIEQLVAARVCEKSWLRLCCVWDVGKDPNADKVILMPATSCSSTVSRNLSANRALGRVWLIQLWHNNRRKFLTTPTRASMVAFPLELRVKILAILRSTWSPVSCGPYWSLIMLWSYRYPSMEKGVGLLLSRRANQQLEFLAFSIKCLGESTNPIVNFNRCLARLEKTLSFIFENGSADLLS